MHTSIVFSLNNHAGFYSMVFYLCKALLTARARRIPLYIDATRWPYTHTRGWHDYFRTLETEPLTRSITKNLFPYRVAHNAQYSDPDFPLSDYVSALREIYKPNPELLVRANALMSRLGTDFVAVFVRRGDKLVEEAEFIPAKDIYEKIGCSQETTLFIQTDDYTVIEEFRQIHPPERIVSTVPPTKRGQYHVRKLLNAAQNPYATQIIPLLDQPKTQVREETEEMIVGLQVCCMAPVCWTDVTSNVGRFLKLMGRNVRVYPNDGSFDMSRVGCPAHVIPFIKEPLIESNGH